jgi:L-alanine-DL-glutamate epimerase-like enolase superfamily enzyme
VVEDPIRTTDLDGLVELNRVLDLPLHIGEFLFSIADFAEYIRRGALDVVRLIADNVGGISSSMRVGMLAEAFNLECTLPNAYWFEMPHPATGVDRPYHKDKFRVDKEGYILAPTEPGLGYPIDRDALDKIMKRVDR